MDLAVGIEDAAAIGVTRKCSLAGAADRLVVGDGAICDIHRCPRTIGCLVLGRDAATLAAASHRAITADRRVTRDSTADYINLSGRRENAAAYAHASELGGAAAIPADG